MQHGTYIVEPKQRTDGRWHWSAVAANGKVVFSGAEGDGFTSRNGAVQNFRRVELAFVGKRVTLRL